MATSQDLSFSTTLAQPSASVVPDLPGQRQGRIPYALVRLVLASVLLAAAWFKASSLAFFGVGGVGLFSSTAFQLAVIEMNWFLGLCLLANVAPLVTRWVATVYVALLACVAGSYALAGETSCPGCFGDLPISSWVMFAVDVVAVLGLVCASPSRPTARALRWVVGLWRNRAVRELRHGFLFSLAALGVLFAGTITVFGSVTSAIGWFQGVRVVANPAVLELGDCAIGARHDLLLQVSNQRHAPVRIVGGTTTCTCVATEGLP